MKIRNRIIALVAASATVFSLTGCMAANEEYEARKELQKNTTLENSLEKNNLQTKRDRENDPNAIRYVYLMNFGQIVGYYTIKGKVSSSGSQMAPENEIVQPWSGGERYIVDSAKDDGTYGQGDPGIFFFTTEGVMVETSLDYISSDEVLPIDVPRLQK